MAYDYHADRPVQGYGLTRVATLIRQARSAHDNVLLFDNGDFLQGTPLSDLTARPGSGWNGDHPVITAMNALNYDAAGLGNHEFNFGLPWLRDTLDQARFPVTCANVLTHRGETPEEDDPFLPPHLLLPRQFKDQNGIPHALTIGVIALVPPQITVWDQFHLSGKIKVRGMEETARHLVPKLRQAGADLIVVLGHTGIDTRPPEPMMENAALPLSTIPGVDVLLAGHSHQLFPDQRFTNTTGADPGRGTLNDTPTVMAGFRGSHLGMVHLALECTDGHWRVATSHAEAQPVAPATANGAPVPEDDALCQVLAEAHTTTMRLTRRPLGYSEAPLHSYMAMVGHCSSVQVVTQAQRHAVLRLLSNQMDPAAPLLTASAAFKVGGRGGPHHFSDVPAGPLFLRHAADLYPFPNVLCVLEITGAQLKDWLERAATVFNTIISGEQGQPLLNPETPGHAFDVIDGVSYQIDLAQPCLYDPQGQPTGHDGPGRIRDLRHAGQPVADDARFTIATNNYRAFGGGPYAAANHRQIVLAGNVQIVDLIAKYLTQENPLPEMQNDIWRFRAMPGTSVVFDTGPGLRAYPRDIASRALTDLGNSEAGFARFSMPL